MHVAVGASDFAFFYFCFDVVPFSSHANHIADIVIFFANDMIECQDDGVGLSAVGAWVATKIIVGHLSRCLSICFVPFLGFYDIVSFMVLVMLAHILGFTNFA